MKLTSKPSNAWLFYIMWGTILVVSVHDGMLVFAHRNTIGRDERNPVGRWLLYIAEGDIWLLLIAKTIGTILVGAILLLIFWTRPGLGWAVCISLVIGQGLLLLVLTYT